MLPPLQGLGLLSSSCAASVLASSDASSHIMATAPSRSRSSRPSSAAESWPSCRARRRRKTWSWARSDQGHADRRERSYERRPRAGRAGLHGPPARRAPWLRQVARARARCYISAAGHPGVPGRVLVRRLRRRRAGRARRPSRWRRGRRRTRRWPTHAGPGVVAHSAFGQADGHPRAVTDPVLQPNPGNASLQTVSARGVDMAWPRQHRPARRRARLGGSAFTRSSGAGRPVPVSGLAGRRHARQRSG